MTGTLADGISPVDVLRAVPPMVGATDDLGGHFTEGAVAARFTPALSPEEEARLAEWFGWGFGAWQRELRHDFVMLVARPRSALKKYGYSAHRVGTTHLDIDQKIGTTG